MKELMKLFKKKEPKFYRILVTENRWSTSGESIIGLIEVFFKKYGFDYVVIDNKLISFQDRMFYYEIEIPYKDKALVETLLYKVFTHENGFMTLNQFERLIKTKRLRQKILNI